MLIPCIRWTASGRRHIGGCIGLQLLQPSAFQRLDLPCSPGQSEHNDNLLAMKKMSDFLRSFEYKIFVISRYKCTTVYYKLSFVPIKYLLMVTMIVIIKA